MKLGDARYIYITATKNTKKNIFFFIILKSTYGPQNKQKMWINSNIWKQHFQFKCGELCLDFASCYKYLGVHLNECSDYSITAKELYRALGVIKANFCKTGGMDFVVFTKLKTDFTYASGLWGINIHNCINNFQSNACKLFIGFSKRSRDLAARGFLIKWCSIKSESFENMKSS